MKRLFLSFIAVTGVVWLADFVPIVGCVAVGGPGDAYKSLAVLDFYSPADFEPDGDVDSEDLAVLAEDWLETEALSADIHPVGGDGIVDFLDFAELAAYWLVCRGIVVIPGGEFDMGDHYGVDGDPVHAVYVGSFYMSTTEVSNRQYCDYLNSALFEGLIEVRNGVVYAVGESEPYCDTTYYSYSSIVWDDEAFSVVAGKGHHPMVQVSWYGAAAYCEFYGLRLPTEAEWECGGRGGWYGPYYMYPWGNEQDGSRGNWRDSGDPYESSAYPRTTPVGFYESNGYGLYDMAGNVWEWCSDWYDANYYTVSPYDNPQGPETGSYRVLRGGGWDSGAIYCRSARRNSSFPSYRSFNLGFRVVMDVD